MEFFFAFAGALTGVITMQMVGPWFKSWVKRRRAKAEAEAVIWSMVGEQLRDG